MKILKGLTIILLLKVSTIHAQYSSRVLRGVDLGIGVADNVWTPSIMYHEDLSLRKFPWLRVSVGVRAWGLYGGQASLHTERVQGTEDHLIYRNVSATGLSFLGGVNVSFWKLDAGVNTDLFALAFGSVRRGYYEKTSSINGTGMLHYNQWLASKPTQFNVLPFARSQNTGFSEAFLRARLGQTVGIKVGYAYSRLVYVIQKLDGANIYLDNNQQHVSKVYGIPYVAVSFAVGD